MIARGWRIVRTGLCFVVFGLSCIGLQLISRPWVWATVRDLEGRQLAFQGHVRRVYQLLLATWQTLGVARFPAYGIERLQEPGILVVANHPTLIDVLVVGARMPTADCITKMGNVENPFMGGVIRAAGHIPNVGGQAIIDEGAARLARGRALLTFVEGTRSPEGGLGEFHRGAAHIALASGRDIVPVLLTSDPPTLMRGQKWYEVPDRTAEITLRVGGPIPVQPYQEAVERGESRGRVARRLTAELREFFEKGIREAAT